MDSRYNVLIPDGDSTWALSVINCLSEHSEYKFFVISNKKRTAVKYSKYISHYKYYEKTSDEDWLKLVLQEIDTHKISVVVPIAEMEFRFFIRHKQLLPNAVKIIPLPELQHFDIAINKQRLSAFLKTQNLPHPKSVYYKNEESYTSEVLDLNFPILFKPVFQKGGDGITKLNSRKALEHHLKTYDFSKGVFLQEYINGYDIDCSVLCLDGDIVTHTVQKGNLNGHNAFAPQLGFDFIRNTKVLDVATQLMKDLQWSGVAHIDMRYDEKTDDYKIIEINARFWGSVEASKFAGINFPDLAIKLALYNTITPVDFKETEFMRLKGVVKSIKRNPSMLFKRKFLLQNTEVNSFIKDPLPICYRFFEWLGRRF